MGPIVLALGVIRELVAAPYGLSLIELAHRLRRPVSTVQRITRVMEDQHLLVRAAPERALLLGPETRRLATQITDSTSDLGDVVAAAAHRTGETVVVARATESGPVLVVAAAPSPQPLRVWVEVGTTTPPAESTIGRVLMAWRDHADVQAVLATVSPVPGPIEMMALFDKLRTIREHGYDSGTDELGTDIWTVTAPIRNACTRAVTGSVTLAAPTTRAATTCQRDNLAAAAVELAARPVDTSLLRTTLDVDPRP